MQTFLAFFSLCISDVHSFKRQVHGTTKTIPQLTYYSFFNSLQCEIALTVEFLRYPQRHKVQQHAVFPAYILKLNTIKHLAQRMCSLNLLLINLLPIHIIYKAKYWKNWNQTCSFPLTDLTWLIKAFDWHLLLLRCGKMWVSRITRGFHQIMAPRQLFPTAHIF